MSNKAPAEQLRANTCCIYIFDVGVKVKTRFSDEDHTLVQIGISRPPRFGPSGTNWWIRFLVDLMCDIQQLTEYNDRLDLPRIRTREYTTAVKSYAAWRNYKYGDPTMRPARPSPRLVDYEQFESLEVLRNSMQRGHFGSMIVVLEDVLKRKERCPDKEQKQGYSMIACNNLNISTRTQELPCAASLAQPGFFVLPVPLVKELRTLAPRIETYTELRDTFFLLYRDLHSHKSDLIVPLRDKGTVRLENQYIFSKKANNIPIPSAPKNTPNPAAQESESEELTPAFEREERPSHTYGVYTSNPNSPRGHY